MGRIFNVILLIVAFSLIGCERNEPSNENTPNNDPSVPGSGASGSGAPGSFYISRCEVVGDDVKLSWTTSSAADYYTVWYQFNDETPFVLESSVYSTSYTDVLPLLGLNTYWVVANNSTGSFVSESRSITYSGYSGGGGSGGDSGGGSGGGGSSTQTEGTVTATVYCSGPGASISSYAQWANGRTTTITWIYRESQNQYYIYGGTYCSDPDANQGRGVLYPCSRGYNSIRVDSDYVYDSYGHAQFYDVYLRFTIP